MNNLGHQIFKGFQDVVSKIKPTMKESKFYEEGKLTPEEYVLAGDYLVMKCPTWKWCAAKKNLTNKSLPPDKQYLLTRVRSKLRADDYLKSNNTKEKIVEGDWVDADLENKPKAETKKAAEIDLDALEEKNKKKEVVANTNNDDDDFVIEGAEEVKKEEKKQEDGFEIVDEEDLKEDKKAGEAGVLKTREYEVTVTYDFYYCVPRMWLMGYNEKGNPLTDDEMKEDVMPEYRNKTCTIEEQPCTGIRNISVHPCRHSLLLKKMIKDFQNSGKKLEIDKSILLFLKFLQSVVPTVQYDLTMDISF
jgi:ubiquitin-like-conjugating enzyme ATG3